VTFYLHIDFEKSQERQRLRNSTKDYFERESESFYQNLINGFNKLVTLYPKRIQQINGSLSVNEIHQMLMNIIIAKMK
jgi:thymidylate kinase